MAAGRDRDPGGSVLDWLAAGWAVAIAAAYFATHWRPYLAALERLWP